MNDINILKSIGGVIAVILSIYGHVPYIRDILANKTKPHVYTWLVWTLLTFISFFAQITDKAGPGAWTTGVTGLLALIILVLSLRHGSRDITQNDTICLVASLVAIVLWIMTSSPVWSVILITLVDGFAFLPTIRKTLKNPEQETLFTYQSSVVRHGISIASLTHYSIATAFYPAALVLFNAVMAWIIIQGRRKTVVEPLVQV